ncbi:MAG: hypothetical protein ABSA47_17125 [Verrucomicrobiota bacterium]|jgi:hypothetical protein
MKSRSAWQYPLRLDPRDGAAVAQTVKETGQSINSVLTLSIRKGLPMARAALSRPPSRVTAVDPLPERLLRRAYAGPDELDGVSPRQLAKFQTRKEPR